MQRLDQALKERFSMAVFFDAADDRWVALVAPCIDDTAWAASILTGAVGKAADFATYAQVSGRHFPCSTGRQRCPSTAISSLDQRLATVQDWKVWRDQVIQAYAALRSEDRATNGADTFISEAHDAGRLVRVDA